MTTTSSAVAHYPKGLHIRDVHTASLKFNGHTAVKAENDFVDDADEGKGGASFATRSKGEVMVVAFKE